jgi:hypothetical protein
MANPYLKGKSCNFVQFDAPSCNFVQFDVPSCNFVRTKSPKELSLPLRNSKNVLFPYYGSGLPNRPVPNQKTMPLKYVLMKARFTSRSLKRLTRCMKDCLENARRPTQSIAINSILADELPSLFSTKAHSENESMQDHQLVKTHQNTTDKRMRDANCAPK